MDIKIQACILDIKVSIDEIYDFLGERRDFIEYKSDLKTKKAIERNIEIIGEAMKRIITVDSNFPINNAKNIIGTRNRIIHSYDNISDDVIWTIVIRELPILKKQIDDLTKEI